MLTQEDREQIREKGISEEQIDRQLKCFEQGFPYLRLKEAASVGRGRLTPTEGETEELADSWNTYTA